MTYTISNIAPLRIITDNKITYQKGYCFTDKYGHTIIQVYGEKNKLLIIKKLRNGKR